MDIGKKASFLLSVLKMRSVYYSARIPPPTPFLVHLRAFMTDMSLKERRIWNQGHEVPNESKAGPRGGKARKEEGEEKAGEEEEEEEEEKQKQKEEQQQQHNNNITTT